MSDKMKPIKKPFINNPSHQRTPNTASPSQLPSSVGNLNSSDKDFSKWSDISALNVNKMHSRDDVDVNANSHHHTIGPKRNQASPGDHIHEGLTSRKIGYGLGYTLTGAKSGNVALTNLIAMLAQYIDFKDTTT